MTYTTNTTITGPSRGTVDAWITAITSHDPKRLDEVGAYLREVYRLAPLANIRAELVVVQAIHETDWFRSYWWNARLNPGGLGITGDPVQDKASRTFPSGTSSARVQIVHLALYAIGKDLPAALKPYQSEDPRWAAAISAGYAGTCPTIADLSGTYAADRQYHTKLVNHLNALEFVIATDSTTAPEPPAEETTMALIYGKVPMYGYLDRFITNKREGFGWNNLGKRNIKNVTLHRMVGTLRGTDGYFRLSNISSYTDFGISTTRSDPGLEAGTIYLWNYPNGIRAPWASGPVSAPFGDGKAMVDRYGINAVNRDGISLEIGGTNEAIDDATWKEIVWFIAYWADQCKVPWTSFPINPFTGFSFVIWHTEYTAGTGKQCPFMWLRDRTPALIADVKAMLKTYQAGATSVPAPTPGKDDVVDDLTDALEGIIGGKTFTLGANVTAKKDVQGRRGWGTEQPVVMPIPAGTYGVVNGSKIEQANGIAWFDFKGPGGTAWVPVQDFEVTAKPEPVPEPTWVRPVPVKELALADPTNEDTFTALTLVNGVKFRAVFDTVEAVRVTKQKQFAIDDDTKVKVTGPDLKPGDQVTAMYQFENDSGTEYYYLSNHARVLVNDMKRIED